MRHPQRITDGTGIADRFQIATSAGAANLITTAGADRVLALDLHASQIQGFFDIPVDHLYAAPILIEAIRNQNLSNLMLISPDAGGVERARAFAKRLKCGLAIVDKRRDAPNKAKAMAVIGDVKGKRAVILDDMADTAGTLTEAANALAENGASEVHACCTHPVLSGPAIDRINDSALKSVVVTDTIPLSDKGRACSKIKILSIASLIGEAIIRSHTGDSVTSLFV